MLKHPISSFMYNLTLFSSLVHDDWDEYIDPCLMAYRTSLSRTTKKTPFCLAFGTLPSCRDSVSDWPADTGGGRSSIAGCSCGSRLRPLQTPARRTDHHQSRSRHSQYILRPSPPAAILQHRQSGSFEQPTPSSTQGRQASFTLDRTTQDCGNPRQGNCSLRREEISST